MKNLIILSSLLAVAACGGAKKGATIGTGKEPPPPPSVGHHNDIATPGNPATAKVEVSADAKKDYNAAIEFFRNSDKNGWNENHPAYDVAALVGNVTPPQVDQRHPGLAPPLASKSRNTLGLTIRMPS